jgi:hypothetical protein
MNIQYARTYTYKRMCLSVNAVEVLYSNILVVVTCTNVICFFLSYYNSFISVNISVFCSILNKNFNAHISLVFPVPSNCTEYYLILLFIFLDKSLCAYNQMPPFP